MSDADSNMSDSSVDTQMGPEDGGGSPVIAQTPQAIARDKQRSTRRGAIKPRLRGVSRRYS